MNKYCYFYRNGNFILKITFFFICEYKYSIMKVWFDFILQEDEDDEYNLIAKVIFSCKYRFFT